MKEEINVSTRRWGKIKKLIHATTLYNGRTVSNRKDLHMLLHSLWSSKEQQGIIARIMSECMGGDSHAANKLYSQASKALKELQQANIPTGPAGISYLAPKVEILQSIVKEAEKLDLSEDDSFYPEKSDVDSPQDLLKASELRDIIYETLSSLGEETRTALSLREFDGLSYEQIAEIVKCPVGTVRSRIFRGREIIEDAISKHMEKNSINQNIKLL